MRPMKGRINFFKGGIKRVSLKDPLSKNNIKKRLVTMLVVIK